MLQNTVQQQQTRECHQNNQFYFEPKILFSVSSVIYKVQIIWISS